MMLPFILAFLAGVFGWLFFGLRTKYLLRRIHKRELTYEERRACMLFGFIAYVALRITFSDRLKGL